MNHSQSTPEDESIENRQSKSPSFRCLFLFFLFFLSFLFFIFFFHSRNCRGERGSEVGDLGGPAATPLTFIAPLAVERNAEVKKNK